MTEMKDFWHLCIWISIDIRILTFGLYTNKGGFGKVGKSLNLLILLSPGCINNINKIGKKNNYCHILSQKCHKSSSCHTSLIEANPDIHPGQPKKELSDNTTFLLEDLQSVTDVTKSDPQPLLKQEISEDIVTNVTKIDDRTGIYKFIGGCE